MRDGWRGLTVTVLSWTRWAAQHTLTLGTQSKVLQMSRFGLLGCGRRAVTVAALALVSEVVWRYGVQCVYTPGRWPDTWALLPFALPGIAAAVLAYLVVGDFRVSARRQFAFVALATLWGAVATLAMAHFVIESAAISVGLFDLWMRQAVAPFAVVIILTAPIAVALQSGLLRARASSRLWLAGAMAAGTPVACGAVAFAQGRSIEDAILGGKRAGTIPVYFGAVALVFRTSPAEPRPAPSSSGVQSAQGV